MPINSSSPWKIYCPSYKRAKTAKTHKLFSNNFCYVVREEEADQYEHLGVPLKVIPSGKVKDISTTRNWILSNKDTDYVIMVDDDMAKIIWLLKRNRTQLNEEQLSHLFDQFFGLCESLDIGMWGMNPIDDPIAYRTYNPFSFDSVCLGPFVAIRDTSIKYDEALPLKEDYDYYLQQLHKYHKVLRANFLMYIVDHQKMAGGCQTYRTSQKEIEQNQLLEKKWGSHIIKANYRNPESINMWVDTKFLSY